MRLPETRQTGGPRAARKLINFDAVRWALATPALAPVVWTFFLASLGLAGFAFLTPSAQALVSRRSPPDPQGEILGVNQSASAMARILGPVCGLALYKATPSHLLPYAFGAALLLLMLPLIPRIRRQDAPV